MNLKKCENGHFYDSDIYEACPHCQQQMSDDGLTLALKSDGERLTEALSMPANPYVNEERIEQLRKAENTGADDQRTVAMYEKKLGKKPVTGWLVSVAGTAFGESFQLRGGRNFIGRSREMDVVLAGDPSVSRDKHAIIVYEPKANVFIAQAGDSRELFYVNNEVVLSNVILKPYDKLTIGGTELVFVPFCGEQFVWDQAED